MWSTKKSDLFLKYLVSYFIVLLIPIIIMSSYIYNSFINVLKNEVITNNLNNLNKIKYVMDSQFLNFERTINQIYLNENLRPFYFEENPSKAITVKNELKNFSSTNSFFSEILIHYKGDDFLYSSSTSYTISSFINDIYDYEEWDEKVFIDNINNSTERSIRSPENVIFNKTLKKRIITFIYPLSGYSNENYGSVLFIVPEDNLKILLKDSFNTVNQSNFIIDNNSKVIATLNSDINISEEELLNLAKNSDEYKEVTFKNNKYFLFNMKSEQTHWSYITIVPIEKVMKQVFKAKFKFIYGLILILILGALVIFYIMNVNYKPINQLKAYTKKFLEVEDNLNEFESVRKTLDYLSDQNTELNTKIKDRNMAQKDFLLFKLLKGEFSSIEHFNNIGADVNLGFSKANFTVAIFYIPKLNDIYRNEKNLLISDIIKIIPSNYTFELFEHIEKDKFLFITNYETKDLKLIEDLLIYIRNTISEAYKVPITIGAGNRCDNINHIPKSYMEASTAIDYRLVKGKDRVIFFSEIIEEENVLSMYPYKNLEQLKISIYQGDLENVQSVLSKIINFIKENNVPIFIARGICFDIISIVASTVEMNKDVVHWNLPDVFSLSNFETVDELSNVMKNLCIDICTCLNNSKTLSCEELINLMFKYISEQYSQCNFSIQEMADYFKMASPNLSQYFKDKTGENIIDYVTKLRMEKAKEVLISTELALKDVSIEIGYYNVSSFIRRFKQIVGTTPGEYRKIYKK